MFLAVLAAALSGNVIDPAAMQGGQLKVGITCYQIVAGDREVGTTLQSVTASEVNGRPVWDIVVHQKAGGGAFDLRDHFIVDRATMLPLRMESARGRERTERGWHRISLAYGEGRVRGTKETAAGVTAIDVAIEGAVWDGNLWGLTFAALPLEEGRAFAIPIWQYDKGIGTFSVRVIGTEDVTTPTGKVSAWIVEAGDRPDGLVRYQIAMHPRLELGYSSERGGQQIGGNCQ